MVIQRLLNIIASQFNPNMIAKLANGESKLIPLQPPLSESMSVGIDVINVLCKIIYNAALKESEVNIPL